MESKSKDDSSVLSDTVSEDTANLTNRLAINLLGEEALIQANTTATRNEMAEPLEEQEEIPTPPVLDTEDAGGTSVVLAMPPSVDQVAASLPNSRKRSSPNTTARGPASKQKKKTA
jgi:hypothetical protein